MTTEPGAIPPEITAWFDARGWRVRRHQADMLAAADRGHHALLVADTGAGKTLSGFLPTLAAFCPSRLAGAKPPEGLHTLYVSPLKALATDVQRNLIAPIEEMGLAVRVETRSGDTPSDRKARQRARPPHVLLTTPESLSLLLSYPEAPQLFASLRHVVVDEVHAFATGKRGDLLALALSRLQAIAPKMQRAALSATPTNIAAGWLRGAKSIPSNWCRASRVPIRRSTFCSRARSAFRGAAMPLPGRSRS
jgi:ATP-dependent Lhr-like helicase